MTQDLLKSLPLENHKNIGSFTNIGPDPLENRKAINLHAIIGPLAKKKNVIKVGPPLTELSGSYHRKSDEADWNTFSDLFSVHHWAIGFFKLEIVYTL